MNKMISVIIPAYNAETKIEKCLSCICKSVYTELEIIVVDDGSTDGTLSCIQAAAEKDARIVVLSQQNGGVSAARNAGLNASTGAFIAFVDADDAVDITIFSTLWTVLTQYDADIACCGMQVVEEAQDAVFFAAEHSAQAKAVTPKEVAVNYFRYLAEGVTNPCCSKLYKKATIGNNRFSQTLKMGEDASFNLQVFRQAQRIAICDDNLYFYVQHKKQATKNRIPNYAEMMVQHFGDIHAYIEEFHGYDNSVTQREMGLYWLDTVVSDASHCNSGKQFAANVKKFAACSWHAYVYQNRIPLSHKQKIARLILKLHGSVLLWQVDMMYNKRRRKGETS